MWYIHRATGYSKVKRLFCYSALDVHWYIDDYASSQNEKSNPLNNNWNERLLFIIPIFKNETKKNYQLTYKLVGSARISIWRKTFEFDCIQFEYPISR